MIYFLAFRGCFGFPSNTLPKHHRQFQICLNKARLFHLFYSLKSNIHRSFQHRNNSILFSRKELFFVKRVLLIQDELGSGPKLVF